MAPPEIRLQGAACELVARLALQLQETPETVLREAVRHYAEQLTAQQEQND